MRALLALVRKEIVQVLRDRVMRIQIVLPPMVQLLLLAQVMTFEVKHTSLAVVDLDRSTASARLVEAFTSTGRFGVVLDTPLPARADDALLRRQAGAVLAIPEGFARDLRSGRAPTVQLVLNAEDGAAAGVVQGYAVNVLAGFARAEAATSPPAMTQRFVRARPGVQVETRRLFNPTGAYRPSMALGLLASLVSIIGILLTSQNIAREREIGTLEQLNVTPLTRSTFLLGKMLPFWALGLLELALGLLIVRYGFGVAFVGSPLLVFAAAALYLPAVLGLGLLISTAAQTQQQAMFLTFFALVTMLFLGGIFTPVRSMPAWAQAVAACNPVQHFAETIRAVLLRGATTREVAGHLAATVAFGAVVLPLAVLRYRKTAD